MTLSRSSLRFFASRCFFARACFLIVSAGGAGLRQAQQKTLEVKRTGMAVAIDLGEASDIHPKNKVDVGERLALRALAYDYTVAGLEHRSPLFAGMKIEGDRVTVSFEGAETGLMVGAKEGRGPVREVKDGTLKRFALRGEDGRWHWFEARIVGPSVVCRSPQGPTPVAVRYAFSGNPEGCNL